MSNEGLKILVVDDEAPARSRLRRLLDELGAGTVVGEAGEGNSALAQVEALAPDLILLDIRMPGMDGLEVARHLGQLQAPPAVIFTTAYDQHALEAIEASAVDYLLKPIRRERLGAAIERAGRLSRAQLARLEDEGREGQAPRTHVSATFNGALKLVPVEAVRYFRAEHKYVTARHTGGELIIEDPLNALESEFGERFLRVHRNALVAIAHVRGLERDDDGQHRVVLDGIEERVEISRRMSSQVRRRLKSG